MKTLIHIARSIALLLTATLINGWTTHHAGLDNNPDKVSAMLIAHDCNTGSPRSEALSGDAIIYGTLAIANCARIQIGDTGYDICYESKLYVVCDEKSPTGNWRRTVWVDAYGDGTYGRKRYVFAGQTYSMGLDQNSAWELYMGT